MIAGRPFLIQALSALLTVYAMAGAWLAMMLAGTRDPRLHWLPLSIGGGVFAVCAGMAALAVWRRERRAPALLIICGIAGAALCTALPAAIRDAPFDRGTWAGAIAGGLLFAAFLLIAARYIQLYLRSMK
jgi:hypothetical protein